MSLSTYQWSSQGVPTANVTASSAVDGESGDRWYAVYTKPHHEKVVARELERRSIPALLPLYRSLHRWRDRRKWIDLPLFPSYVFLKANPSRRIQILSTPGCLYLLSNSRGPLAIEPHEIASVRIMSEARVARPCPFLRSGTRVRVVRGPLAGVEGILELRRNLRTVVVSINALANSIRAEVPCEDVEPI